MEHVMQYIQRTNGRLAELGFDERLLYMLRQWHDDTWQCYGTHDKRIAMTHRGTKQGNIFGGILFDMIPADNNLYQTQ